MEFQWVLLYLEKHSHPDVHDFERCIPLEFPSVEEITQEDAVFAARNVWAGIVVSRRPEERAKFFNPRVSCQTPLSFEEEMFEGIVGIGEEEEEDVVESPVA